MIDSIATIRQQGRAAIEIVPTRLAQQLEDYWRACCHGSGRTAIPRRREVDPVALGRLLPHLFLMDIVGPAGRLRWRLVGGVIIAREGADPTGRWVEDSLVPEQAEIIRLFSGLTAQERRPSCHAGRWRDSLGQPQLLARLLVPLSEDGIVVSTLLGLIDYAPGEIVPLRGAA
jgi:hypothetical protein